MTTDHSATVPGSPAQDAATGSRPLPVRRLLWLIPLGFLGNLLYALIATDPEALRAALDLDARYLVLALILALSPILCNALRLWRWGRFLQPEFRYFTALRVVLIAEVGCAVTPTAIGGAPLKIAALSRSGFSPAAGVTLAAIGTLEDIVFISLAIPIAAMASGLLPHFVSTLGQMLAAVWPGHGLWLAAGLAAVLAVAGWSLLRARRAHPLRERVHGFWRQTVANLELIRRRGRGVFIGNLVIAALQWSARLSILTALVAGLGVTLEPVRTAVLQWLCFTCMVLSPTPGAIGGAEAAFVLVFGRELPAALVPLSLAAWRLVTFYGLNLIGLLVLVLTGSRRRLPRRVPDHGGDLSLSRP
jgi:glycosyltransferase 2 family protein